jgi:triphosphatase
VDDGAATEQPTEVEWQFEAGDLGAVERWLAELASRSHRDGSLPLTVLAKPARRLVDRYLDTEDWRIARAGFVLRTRQRGRGVELTMKDTKPADPDGLRHRLELTEPVPDGKSVLEADGPVTRRVDALVGRRPLVQVLQVRTRRRPYSLRAGGAEVAEVALDETVIVAGTERPVARLSRVEVEVVPSWAGALAQTVHDLRSATGLRPATTSKYEAGLQAAGVAVPGPPDVGPADVPRHATLADLALAVLRAQVRELIAHEPGTRMGEDPEELHDMRVATRRLRAAFSVFADVFGGRGGALEAEVRWVAAELGAVRDLDVQLERSKKAAAWAAARFGEEFEHALGTLSALIEGERAEARRHLVESLDSDRFQQLVTALVAVAREDPARMGDASAVPAAGALALVVEERRRRALSASRRAKRSGEAHDFHRLRIRGKRLRYAVEFTTALYGRPASRFATKLAGLQDALGRIQDAEVGAGRLVGLAGPPEPGRPSLPPEALFAIGGLAERYRAESEELRRTVRSSLRVLDGKAWRRLRAAMHKASEGSPAHPGAPAAPARPEGGALGGPEPAPDEEHDPQPDAPPALYGNGARAPAPAGGRPPGPAG